MTENPPPENGGTWAAPGPPKRVRADAEFRLDLEALSVALHAARLAMDAAEEAPYKLGSDPSLAALSEGWRASNLMLREVFTTVEARGHAVITAVGERLGLE